MITSLIRSIREKPHHKRKMIALGISLGVAGVVAFFSVFILVQDIYRMQALKKKSPVERPHFFAQVAELFTRAPELPPAPSATSTEVEVIDVNMSSSTTSTSTIPVASSTVPAGVPVSTSTPAGMSIPVSANVQTSTSTRMVQPNTSTRTSATKISTSTPQATTSPNRR